MAPIFLDTNVLLRHLLADHPDHSPKASAFLAQVESGEIKAFLSDTVVFETVFNLQRRYGITKEAIRTTFLGLFDVSTVDVPSVSELRRALDLYVDFGLGFADAYHVAMMERLGIEEIASFDRDFDRIASIRRVEPA